MKVADLSQAVSRLSGMTEKSSPDLELVLRKWFTKHFVKGANILLLRSIHRSNAYPAFGALLGAASEVDLFALLAKVDPHRKAELLNRSRSDIEAHISALAACAVEPAPKAKKSSSGGEKKSRSSTGRAKVGILSTSRYGSGASK